MFNAIFLMGSRKSMNTVLLLTGVEFINYLFVEVWRPFRE